MTFSFSPLATSARVLPSEPADSDSMVALVIVLSGKRSQGRWPSPVPRMASGKISTSRARSLSLGPVAAVPMKVPGLASARVAGITDVTTGGVGSWMRSVSPSRDCTTRVLPSSASTVPRMRRGSLGVGKAGGKRCGEQAKHQGAAHEEVLVG